MHRKLFVVFVVVLATCVGGFAQDRPRIVKRFHLYNQTGDTGLVKIYTPKAGHGALFRINTFMVTTVGNGVGGFFCARLFFATKFGPNQVSATNGSCLLADQAGNIVQGTIPIADEGGKPLSVIVSTAGDTSGAKYNVTIIVEEL
jgi:hypothetical protein